MIFYKGNIKDLIKKLEDIKGINIDLQVNTSYKQNTLIRLNIPLQIEELPDGIEIKTINESIILDRLPERLNESFGQYIHLSQFKQSIYLNQYIHPGHSISILIDKNITN